MHLNNAAIIDTSLPKVWERSIAMVVCTGNRVPTEHDKPGDPLSRDLTMQLVVENPFEEPMIHKAIPMGLEELELYRKEVVEGIHDHWIDGEENHWRYSYHDRFVRYPVYADGTALALNQIDNVVDVLFRTPYSRRALMITWVPLTDRNDGHPPCLQQMWFRVVNGKLNAVATIRSNDAWKAAFSNMYANVGLAKSILDKLNARRDADGDGLFEMGSYTHFAYSYHIYGCDLDAAGAFVDKSVDSFVETRCFRSDDPAVKSAFENAWAHDPDFALHPEVAQLRYAEQLKKAHLDAQKDACSCKGCGVPEPENDVQPVNEEPEYRCMRCGAAISAATADDNGGLCESCPEE